ncbi:hypothetical protein TcG_10542 [Trypanosoma cruzi]|nr:hypothetical protein TcG_10542 [Trypanosoma cruzi]
MAPARTHPYPNVTPRKQLYACHAYECVWDAFNVANVGSNAEHTAGQRKQTKQNNHHNYSYFIHRTTVDVHMSPWLSAGTHSPCSLLAHSGARQRGYGEQQRDTHPRRAAEAAVDFAET